MLFRNVYIIKNVQAEKTLAGFLREIEKISGIFLSSTMKCVSTSVVKNWILHVGNSQYTQLILNVKTVYTCHALSFKVINQKFYCCNFHFMELKIYGWNFFSESICMWEKVQLAFRETEIDWILEAKIIWMDFSWKSHEKVSEYFNWFPGVFFSIWTVLQGNST